MSTILGIIVAIIGVAVLGFLLGLKVQREKTPRNSGYGLYLLLCGMHREIQELKAKLEISQ